MSKASGFVPKVMTPVSSGGSGASIDDTAVAADKTWSSAKIAKAPDTFAVITGTNTYTLSGTPVAPASSKAILNGVQLDYTTMFTISSNQITLIPAGLEFYLETGMSLSVWWY